MEFFDSEIILAIQKRETSYINRMTKIFTSQFKSKYASLINKLKFSEDRVVSMDQRMEILRSQLELSIPISSSLSPYLHYLLTT